MITYLQGRLVEKYPTRIILDVRGVGYEIHIALSSYQKIGSVGESIKILTYLYVKEDQIRLYGFASIEERELFVKLIAVPGIGPRKAQTILSGFSVEDFEKFIIEENLPALSSISGVGRKTAQRLIVDLKEKIEKQTRTAKESPPHLKTEMQNLFEEAILALISLGYSRHNAHHAVQQALKESSAEVSLEDLIKKALQHI